MLKHQSPETLPKKFSKIKKTFPSLKADKINNIQKLSKTTVNPNQRST